MSGTVVLVIQPSSYSKGNDSPAGDPQVLAGTERPGRRRLVVGAWGMKSKCRLLDGHTLCEIPRLIDVSPLEDGRVVGEQLQRDTVDCRRLDITDLPRHLDDRDSIAR